MMKTSGVRAVFLILTPVLVICVLAGTVKAIHSSTEGKDPSTRADPVLLNTCLITNDIQRLTTFYERILGIPPQKSGAEYVEFRTTAGTLALFSAAAQEKYIPGSATAGQNHSAILEFRVANVDAEYGRLHSIVKSWVKGPTTQPWGTRSIYFRDPDGNLMDFFMPGHPNASACCDRLAGS
jgi:catechol 2,3-dioxygenase-like lactoylglutathione lyase family enzyme